MDVDVARFRRPPCLSEDERKKQRESGACFYCGGMDHFAKDCPKSQGNKGRGGYRGRGRGYRGRGSKPTYRNRHTEFEEGRDEARRLPTAEEIGQAIASANEAELKEIKGVLNEVAIEADF